MPFYSRHSSDGRDRFLGDIQDEEEYDQFMNMIFISSSCTDEREAVHFTTRFGLNSQRGHIFSIRNAKG